MGEQQIQLLKRPALGFGEAEESPQEDQESRGTPDKSSVPPEVELARVHKVRLDDVGDDGDDVIRVAGEHNGLLPEARRAYLGGDGPAELADGQLEDEGPDQRQDGLGEADRLPLGPHVEDANDHEGCAQAADAKQVRATASNVRHDGEPADQGPHESHGGAAGVEQVRLASLESDLLEEVLEGIVSYLNIFWQHSVTFLPFPLTVELYAKVDPDRTWPAKATQAISVRRSSVPLKQSR